MSSHKMIVGGEGAQRAIYPRRRVLVVDGGPGAANRYPPWLAAGEHETSLVADAAQAHLLAPVLRPHVVLVDLEHATPAELDLVASLPELPELHRTRFLALIEQAADRTASEVAGFDICLEKPSSEAELVAAVRLLGPRPRQRRLVIDSNLET